MYSHCRIRKLWISLSVHPVYRTEAYSKIPGVIWHHRQPGTIACKLLGLVEQCQPGYLAQNVSFNKERSRFCLENLRSARCSPYEFFKVLAARKTSFITARARKNKRTARMLASARKDHSIPLIVANPIIHRLVPTPWRFEIRQWAAKTLLNTNNNVHIFFFTWKNKERKKRQTDKLNQQQQRKKTEKQTNKEQILLRGFSLLRHAFY